MSDSAEIIPHEHIKSQGTGREMNVLSFFSCGVIKYAASRGHGSLAVSVPDGVCVGVQQD